jgi:hypothetical protein
MDDYCSVCGSDVGGADDAGCLECNPEEKQCRYIKAWIGQCHSQAMDGHSFCEDHLELKCSSCKKQATGNCDTTMGPMICGAELCDECEHMLSPDGVAGHMVHCKKGEQLYKLWMFQEGREKDINKGIAILADIRSSEKLIREHDLTSLQKGVDQRKADFASRDFTEEEVALIKSKDVEWENKLVALRS